MKKNLSLFLGLIILFTSCKSKIKYSDFNESDFYEVQGIINYANPSNNPFDVSIVKNIGYSYFLDRPIHLKGEEKNIEMFEPKKGYPLIVLVHKDNENISFYGRVGILKTLNNKEKEFLKKHIQDEIKKIE
ncbi:hypothetical protein [Gelatiniphilus marinus]|uniref:Lipoprotein n=1 Tax=Gelatiniphilus marinus TaxID=1759464 RepID=A0ABW5JNA0_9FLAO